MITRASAGELASSDWPFPPLPGVGVMSGSAIGSACLEGRAKEKERAGLRSFRRSCRDSFAGAGGGSSGLASLGKLTSEWAVGDGGTTPMVTLGFVLWFVCTERLSEGSGVCALLGFFDEFLVLVGCLARLVDDMEGC